MRTKVIFVVPLLAAFSNAAWPQRCPDWSAKFDQVDDRDALQQLQLQRSQGWPQMDPARNGGVSLQQQLDGGAQLTQQAQQQIRTAQQIWSQIGVGPKPIVTATQCKQMNAGAAMAAVCEEHIARNMLFTSEGLVDLMRCRAGLPAGSYTSAPSGPVGPDETVPPNLGDPFHRGAASVADLNVSKRAGMVNSAVKNWQTPAEQQSPQSSLAQSTTLADPFANPPMVSASGNQSGNSDNTSQWNDPFAGNDVETGSRDPASTDDTAAKPSEAEIETALATGTANSREVSITPVAQVADTSSWDQFVSGIGSSTSVEGTNNPGPTTSDVMPDATDKKIDTLMSGAGFINDRFNSDASGYVVGEGIKTLGTTAHLENRLLNDIDALSSGDSSATARLNSDLDSFPRDFARGLPGYKYYEYADTLEKDLTNWQKAVLDKVESFKSFLSGTKQCDPFVECEK